MRKVSEILQMAIDKKIYVHRSYMCHAIDELYFKELITQDEREFMKKRLMKQVSTVFMNRRLSGKMAGYFYSGTPVALVSCFINEEDRYKCCMQYYKKWIRDLKRRGN